VLKPLVTVVALMLTTLASADLIKKHNELCLTAPGGQAEGSCRILVSPKATSPMDTFCMASYMRAIPCGVRFVAEARGAGILLTCGDPKKPLINQAMAAEVSSYNVAAVLDGHDGTQTLIDDPKSYTVFSSQMVEVHMTEEEGKEQIISISLRLATGAAKLDNVVCE
jgi:hypothetical protein